MDELSPLHRMFQRALTSMRRPDGGFPLGLGESAEIEPTAVAALALDDAAARSWLETRQRGDGGFDADDAPPTSPSLAALAAVALGRGDGALRALRFAVDARSLPLPDAADPRKRRGWGWTEDARSLVEPTCRVLLAVKHLEPGNAAVRREGVQLLAERQCSDGGWNTGVASALGVDLRGYGQTTAFGLIALEGERRDLVEPAIAFLAPRWRAERGGLTLAQALLAFRLHGIETELAPVTRALGEAFDRRGLLGRGLALAWATLATAPDERLASLRSAA